ncbi:hypothetical protein F4820DRAFT_455403 [Hypoxylon rubiginosum]|uniref:Uncharacterized protein n=1 Tax=Hypoxylon rubiginosum TaxID=110542 RepID=A0ACB9ZFA5_9PEZI|nr:hypothetical protein F4820DRAFT_455403 [Hypoxylon rubiginosum]
MYAVAATAISILLATVATPASAECTRDGLLAAAASYVAAQASGSTENLPLSATNFTYRLNNAAVDIAAGPLGRALPVDYNRTSADTTACASYTLLISASGPAPYVISTQIRHPTADDGSSNDTTSEIALIDTIAATTGALFFDAARTLSLVSQENWAPLEETQRPSREELKRVGDAYLDMWTDAGAADTIPWGTDCERVEGSMLTRPCGATLPRGGSQKTNGDRRYVVDEALGSVDVLCSFDALGDMPDSHEVRVEGGLVKYVHTVTVLQ